MTRLGTTLLAFIATALVSACGDGGGSGPTDAGEIDTDTFVGDAGTGDYCELNEDCETGFCESYQTAPPDPDAVCADGPGDDNVRMLGTLRDFVSLETIATEEVRIAGAMPVLADPLTAPTVAQGTTNDLGRYDILGDDNATKEMIGLVALVENASYYLTASGVVEPEIGGYIYPAGARNHDIWVVSESMIAEWSDLLVAHDSGLSPYVPLGEKGGVIGKIRDQDTGEPAAGIELVSRTPSSIAQIFYLNSAGDGLQTGSSSSNGHFIVLDASLAEKLDAYQDDVLVSVHEATLGQTFGGIFTTAIQVNDDDL
ncbi:MAG: hypothetical protein JRF63_01915 [Deltaproteobacteria bacterium]|nr:hypothetical protein [Deltaproteobacteria bacterium]